MQEFGGGGGGGGGVCSKGAYYKSYDSSSF